MAGNETTRSEAIHRPVEIGLKAKQKVVIRGRCLRAFRRLPADLLEQRPYGSATTTAKEFVDFWLDVSVHADEQEGSRQGQAAVQHLADNLLNAAREQGFAKEQVEAELGDNLEAYIRASIDRQNFAEENRLRNETDLPEVK